MDSRNLYVLKFSGRTKGAIGVNYTIIAERVASSPEAARLALYSEFENIIGDVVVTSVHPVDDDA